MYPHFELLFGRLSHFLHSIWSNNPKWQYSWNVFGQGLDSGLWIKLHQREKCLYVCVEWYLPNSPERKHNPKIGDEKSTLLSHCKRHIHNNLDALTFSSKDFSCWLCHVVAARRKFSVSACKHFAITLWTNVCILCLFEPVIHSHVGVPSALPLTDPSVLPLWVLIFVDQVLKFIQLVEGLSDKGPWECRFTRTWSADSSNTAETSLSGRR